ncbi:MAG TPA: hypothetical protein VME24_06420 [Alphaproteobacteria bacterium]|nr:hypothetical protein [Alphaproteobacteria bacterium]
MKFSQSNAVHSPRSTARGRQLAFTLMEVMIAIAVFCIGVFAILGLVASVMRGARLLDKPMVDAGVVASEIQTNSMVEVEGVSGDLSEFLGDTYKGYDYVYEIHEEQSNHLYHATIAVTSDTPGKPVISKMDVLYFAPQSPPGSLDSGYMNTMQH